MAEDDRNYFRRRAEVELEQAQRATTPRVVRAHYEMANAYLGRLQATAQPASAPDA